MQAVAGAKVKPEPSWPPAMYKLSQPITGPMIGPFREKGRKPTLSNKKPNEQQHKAILSLGVTWSDHIQAHTICCQDATNGLKGGRNKKDECKCP